MASKRTWITAGAAGTLGVALVAAGAITSANAFDLRAEDGTAIAEAAQAGAQLSDQKRYVAASDGSSLDSVHTVSAPTAPTAPSPHTVSAPSPATAPTGQPDSAPTPASAPSPTSAPSAPSPASVPSPVTPPSAPSANSPQSN